MNRKQLLVLCITLLLAACDNPPVELTPTYSMSGPTLQPTQEFYPEVQSSEPTDQMFLGQNDPTAAAMPSGGELPPLSVGITDLSSPRQSVQVTADDGTQMTGDLYMARGGEAAPGILMLAPDRTVWLDLPLRLQNAGFTVMAMDLRPNGVAADVDLMLRALTQMELVDAGHMGVIAAELGADLSLVSCAQGSPCDALVMLSPVNGDTLEGAILQYNPRPLFMSVGEDDASFAVADRFRASVRGELTFEPIAGSARGAGLVQASPALGDSIIEWLGVRLGG